MQQEIVRTLRQIDNDIHEFTKCLELQSAGDLKQSDKRLGDLSSALKAHRAKIRAWTAQSGAKLPSKDKLGAARSRIEQELRRYSDFEKRKVNQAKSSAIENTSSTEQSETSDVASVEDEEVGTELKIMSEQLCADDAEEMEMAKEFVCQICFHVVGHTPQLSRCSHLFCGDCIGKWFEVHPGNQTWARRAQTKGSVPCPICKEPLQKENDLHAVSPEGDGNGAVLWQMLCSLQVMCANHYRNSPEGKCNWIGDYGSYQEHIHSCKNVPLVYSERAALVDNVTTPEVDVGSDADIYDDIKVDMATIASTTSVTIYPDSTGLLENPSLPDTSLPDQSSDPAESYLSGDVESSVEAHATEEKSLTSLIAELIDLRAKEPTRVEANGEGSTAADLSSTAFDAIENADAVDTQLDAAQVPTCFTLNAAAAPFQPAGEKKNTKKQVSHKITQGARGSPPGQWQAAALQYQAACAQQMAYLHRLHSAQMAQYQAACWHAHMNQNKLAQSVEHRR